MESNNGKSHKMKIVYSISERENGKSYWTRIGVGFVNQDGSINLRLDAIPMNGQNIQVREYEPYDPSRSYNNNSAVTFSDGSSTLRLANSSAQPWDSSAILYVTNWHGSTSGGGATQLYFGSNSSGLTAQQLAQIQFALSTGVEPATILATGEVVPAGATLDFTRNGSTLTLTWPSGWFLQSATNVTGPYNDVPETASPYPVDMASPRQFFRLRQ